MTEATTSITQEDIIARLKLSGAWFDAIGELEDEALIAKVSADEGLQVSDDELQESFDDYRRDLELLSAEDTNKWLAESGITVDQVEAMLESSILRGKLADKLIDDAEIDAHYSQNPADFEYAEICQIAVADAGAAEELALSIREEGEDFAELAKKHSLDEPTKEDGGYLGVITREDATGLPSDVADRIFSGSAGEVVGPFELPGGAHVIIRVEDSGRAELDEDLREMLRQFLFGQKMDQLSEG